MTDGALDDVLVTGGAGFIGANLVRRLLDDRQVASVGVIDDLSTGRRENLPAEPRLELHIGSVLDEVLLDEVVGGTTSIVHLAARSSVPRSVDHPVPAHEANATGTIRVLEAARRHGVDHVVVASSSSVYGNNPALPKREDMAQWPISPYAASKLATEAYTTAWQHSYGMRTLSFRFFNVFGPMQPTRGSYSPVLPAFIDAALGGRALPVHGDGTQSRDFTYVGTVADVIARAVTGRISHPHPVNLAFGTNVSLLEIIDELGRIIGRDLEVEHQPARVGDVRATQADPAVFRRLFPDVEPVDWREGLALTVEWWRQQPATPA
jgi:UDP-glucose 4-epimerase